MSILQKKKKKKCIEIDSIAEIIDENVLKKPTVANIGKLCVDLKKHNEILFTNQNSSKTNPAKLQKSNSSKNSISVVETDNETKLHKITLKAREERRTELKTTIQN